MGAGGRLNRRQTRLPRGFYARHPSLVAPELLGRTLVRERDGVRLAGRIVEAEAYARDDPASHSFNGRTARNATMFDRAGHLYVYRSYGIHACANVVTGEGEGSAVLIRALEPLDGLEVMRGLRQGRPDRDICAGPGRLTQALGLGLDDDGLDLLRSHEVWIEAGSPVPAERIVATTRIGVSRAPDVAWRFLVRDDPWVSRRVSAASGRAASRR